MKRQGSNIKKLFAKHISNEGLVSRIYEKNPQLIILKIHFFKCTKYLNGHFTRYINGQISIQKMLNNISD